MDLTKSIIVAKSYLKDVQIDQIISMIDELSDELNCLIDWDKDDGEQWGRLMQDKRVVVLFNAKLPLLFVDNDFHTKAVEYFESNDMSKLVVLKVESWDKADNSVDFSVLSGIVDWHSSSISQDQFSINELWFATV